MCPLRLIFPYWLSVRVIYPLLSIVFRSPTKLYFYQFFLLGLKNYVFWCSHHVGCIYIYVLLSCWWVGCPFIIIEWSSLSLVTFLSWNVLCLIQVLLHLFFSGCCLLEVSCSIPSLWACVYLWSCLPQATHCWDFIFNISHSSVPFRWWL